jgi:hypothetical protein
MQNITAKNFFVCFLLLPDVVNMTENYKSWVYGDKVLRKTDGTKKAVVSFYYESDSTSSGQAVPVQPF